MIVLKFSNVLVYNSTNKFRNVISMSVFMFNYTTAYNQINIRNKEPYFEFYEVIKYDWPLSNVL